MLKLKLISPFCTVRKTICNISDRSIITECLRDKKMAINSHYLIVANYHRLDH